METSKLKNKILAFDPSLRAWGWAVLDADGKVYDCGAIRTKPQHKKMKTRKGDDTIRRANEIIDVIDRICNSYDIKLIVSEQPHGSQSASAAMMIGLTAGIAQTWAQALHYPIEWFTEGDSKKSITGKRSVGKDEMIEVVNRLYEVPWCKTKEENRGVADAIAVFHCAKIQSEFIKFLS